MAGQVGVECGREFECCESPDSLYPDTAPSHIYWRGYDGVLCDIVRIVGFLAFLVD